MTSERCALAADPVIPTYHGLLFAVTLDCGQWIQQEEPEETNRVILTWLDQR